MNTKICSSTDCQRKGEQQPLENFYKHSGHKDGYCSRCKACEAARRQTAQGKATVKKWNNSLKGKAAMQRYETSEHGCQHRREYMAENAEHFIQFSRSYSRSAAGKATIQKYKDKHPEVYEGHKAVLSLVNRGIISHPKTLSCVDCGKQATEYHHHNGYSAEHIVDVIPICFKCHKKRHRKYPISQTS